MSSFGSRIHPTAGILIAITGAALVVVAALGQWTSLGGGNGWPKRDWERFDPSLATALKDYDSLVAELDRRLDKEGLPVADRIEAVYGLIADWFTHDEAAHTIWSNWILYLAGYVHPPFWHVWSTDRYVSHGHSLLCDQASYLMVRLLMEQGIKARQIGLQGHVVMEAWYDGDWHLYDPDLEVVPRDELGEVLSLDELARNEILREKYYGRHTNMAELIEQRENHLFMSAPEGARFEWKGNLLVIVERVCDWLKFLIPAGMIVLGWRLFKSCPPRAANP